MRAITRMTDADRVRRATRSGRSMLGPTELAKCEHGRGYSYRWAWRIGETIEDGDVEIVSHSCNLCWPDDDTPDADGGA